MATTTETYTTDLVQPEEGTPEHTLMLELTGQARVEQIAVALRNAAYDFSLDDCQLLDAAQTLAVQDGDAYARGCEILAELLTLEETVVKTYARFDKPLNYLIGVVRESKGPQLKSIKEIKQSLSARLGSFQVEQDRLAKAEAARKQALADAAAKAEQEAKAAILDRAAAFETNPAIAESIRIEAESVRATESKAAPVEPQSLTPKIKGSALHTKWEGHVVDLYAFMQAYVARTIVLDTKTEEAICDALKPFLNAQASALQSRLGMAFPGAQATSTSGTRVRRTNR